MPPRRASLEWLIGKGRKREGKADYLPSFAWTRWSPLPHSTPHHTHKWTWMKVEGEEKRDLLLTMKGWKNGMKMKKSDKKITPVPSFVLSDWWGVGWSWGHHDTFPRHKHFCQLRRTDHISPSPRTSVGQEPERSVNHFRLFSPRAVHLPFHVHVRAASWDCFGPGILTP